MSADLILPGGAVQGDVASVLLQNNFDVAALRPYHVPHPTNRFHPGYTYVSRMNANGQYQAVPVHNTTATLRKDDWIQLDQAIVRAARPRLRAVADLRSAGLVYSIPNGMAKTVLQTEKVSDISPAAVSMDGLRESQADRPYFDLGGLPLPIIHKDFHFSARQVAASRTGGSPLDTTSAESAARRVAEEAEKMLCGTSTVADLYKYAGYSIYGYTDFPTRNTQVITAPTTTGWTGATLVTEVLAMLQTLLNDNHFGPFMLYVSKAWSRYLGEDYSAAKGNNTVRQRLQAIEDVSDVRTLDYLNGFDIVLVQMSPETVREVIGMELTTVQWQSKGGMQLNYKVMAIMVPQIRDDITGKCGICHGSTS